VLNASYARVVYRGSYCPTCWENRRGDALRLNSDQASHRMLAAKWQPLEQYPGTVEAPWLAQCLVCNETG